MAEIQAALLASMGQNEDLYDNADDDEGQG
jgi:hypothetical protein